MIKQSRSMFCVRVSNPTTEQIVFFVFPNVHYLKSCLKGWLLGRAAKGYTAACILDDGGQGVIHMCSILGYTWAVQMYSRLGLLLDFKDAFGWTDLHWVAFYGRKQMVAVLLPSLVTDHPT